MLAIGRPEASAAAHRGISHSGQRSEAEHEPAGRQAGHDGRARSGWRWCCKAEPADRRKRWNQPTKSTNPCLPVSQRCTMPASILYGQDRRCTLGEMRDGTVSGMDESYWKPAAASAARVAVLCSKNGALRQWERAGGGSDGACGWWWVRGGGLELAPPASLGRPASASWASHARTGAGVDQPHRKPLSLARGMPVLLASQSLQPTISWAPGLPTWLVVCVATSFPARYSDCTAAGTVSAQVTKKVEGTGQPFLFLSPPTICWMMP